MRWQVLGFGVLTLLCCSANGAAGDEAPRNLTERELDNLVAFARLLGYVRYFHPSDEAANANWD
ncbi:MAG: hypothetical protein L0Z62_49640, partial [Gemmataceae bacterium]|nr:hypothetical protein [Gemmataceae bacterium]